MKKSFTILVLFIFISIALKAQKEVLFKINILPNTNYSSVTQMDVNMEMSMVGDSTFMNEVKTKGMKFPMIMQMQTSFNSNVKTRMVNAQKEIPFTMSMQSQGTKMTMNGEETPIPVSAINQIYYGVYTSDMKAKIDSVGGKSMDETLKASITKMIEGIQGNIKFPEKPMKIGDTFLQDVPMDLPIAGFPAKMICKTTYKLISIVNNKANFDLQYVLQMDMTGEKMSLDMTGNGDGNFVYNMTYGYPENMVNNMTMSYSMVMPQSDKVKMNGKAKMVTNLHTTISKN